MSGVAGDKVRVLALPARHPFVQRIVLADGDEHIDLVIAPPGTVDDERPGPGEDTGELVDVVHVHFGYDYLDPESVDEVVGRLTDKHLPMMLTVHDIVYPQERSERPNRIHTGTLVESARKVTTLTLTAAHEIWVRWGVQVAVVPHSALLTDDEVQRARAVAARTPADGPRIGILLERLGENFLGVEALEKVAAAVASRRGARMVVVVLEHAWRDAADPGHHRHDVRAWIEAAVERGEAEVVQYEVENRETVHDTVAGFSAFVLPYRFGTHSSWLELCRDLEVPPVFSAVGCLREQWFDRSPEDAVAGEVFHLDDLDSLPSAVRSAVDTRLPTPVRIRGASEGEVVTAYETLYREIAGR